MKRPFVHLRFLQRGSLLGLGGGILMVAAGLLAGCQIIPEPVADQTRYYVLTSGLTPPSAEADSPPGSVTLGVRDIELASYLDSRALVVRLGTNELAYQDYALWAEPLDQGIARLLRAQLLASPKVSQVHVHPLPFSEPRDFEVAIRILRCEGVREEDGAIARFSALIEIISTGNHELVSRKLFTAPDVPWDGQDHASLVAALSEATRHLAAEVIQALPGS